MAVFGPNRDQAYKFFVIAKPLPGRGEFTPENSEFMFRLLLATDPDFARRIEKMKKLSRKPASRAVAKEWLRNHETKEKAGARVNEQPAKGFSNATPEYALPAE